MEEHFWQTRWKEGRTGFHDGVPNPHLMAQFRHLKLGKGAHVFVPLCGKTVDLDWLLAQGHRVTGIEFNAAAARAVFERLKITPQESQLGPLTRLQSEHLTLWIGDFFALKASDLGPVDAVYDRAALVALPDHTRKKYAQHLTALTGNAPQLLISYTYDQTLMEGPPFAVPETTIRSLYAATFKISPLDQSKVTGPLAARITASEEIWMLTPNQLAEKTRSLQ